MRLDIVGEGVIFIENRIRKSYDLLSSKMLKTLLIISTLYVAGESIFHNYFNKCDQILVRASEIRVKSVRKMGKLKSGLWNDINRLITPLASLSSKSQVSRKKKLLSKHHACYVPSLLSLITGDLFESHFLFILFVAHAAGRLQILQSPKSLSFKGTDRLESESLADVLAASLGFSVTHPSDWKGLYINDPFNPATGVVAVVIDGPNNFDHVNSAKTHSFDLIGSGAQESLDSLVFRVQEHNAEAIDLDLTQGFDVVSHLVWDRDLLKLWEVLMSWKSLLKRDITTALTSHVNGNNVKIFLFHIFCFQ